MKGKYWCTLIRTIHLQGRMDFGRRNCTWYDQGPHEANTKVGFSKKVLLLVKCSSIGISIIISTASGIGIVIGIGTVLVSVTELESVS